MFVVGVLVAALMGRLSGPSGIVEGMLDIAQTGIVGIVIPLSAIMMLWLGILRLGESSGIINAVARAVRPVMKWLFPEVPPEHPAISAMVMNMAANLLGLGNAATPLGLKAMQHLDELNPEKGTATNPMCTFLAINTSSVTLIPATAISILAAQGVKEPYAIVGTTLGASLCATLVAIMAAKTFAKIGIFDHAGRRSQGATAELAEEDIKPADRKLGTGAKWLLGLVVFCFLAMAYLETFPEQRTALQNAIGLSDAVARLEAPAPVSKVEVSQEAPPLWQDFISSVSVVAIPFILVFFLIYAGLKKVSVYDEFVEGAKEGWTIAVRIMPYIVAMLAALATLRNSGTLMLLQDWLQPVLNWLNFPAELLPMALMRPLSGSGSMGVLAELVANESLPDLLKYMAATMYGSTETTFYVLAVYFGSVSIRRTRHALAAGLVADFAGIMAAVIICRAMFG